MPRLTISRISRSIVASNRATPMWKVKSQAEMPSALESQRSSVASGSSVRLGQHISMSVVVPPTSAARLPES